MNESDVIGKLFFTLVADRERYQWICKFVREEMAKKHTEVYQKQIGEMIKWEVAQKLLEIAIIALRKRAEIGQNKYLS